MAPFNPEVSKTPTSNFINASQGSAPNKALGTLFETIGDVAQTYQKNKEVSDKKDLAKEVQAGVDALDTGIMGDVSLLDPMTNPESKKSVPAGISSSQRAIDRLKQAHEQGKLSDTNYIMQVAKLSKELRSKYPEYIDTVDDLISNATGTSTANMLRRELTSVWEKEAASASAEQKEKTKFYNEVLEAGYLSDPYILEVYKQASGGKDFNGADFNDKALRFAIGVRELEDKNVSREKDRLALAESQGKADSKDAIKVATTEAAVLRDRALYAAGSSFQTLQKNMQEMGKDGFDPTEKEALSQMLGRIELEMSMKADELTSGVDKQGRSYASLITNDSDRKAIRDVMLNPIATIRNALLNNETGVLTAIERDNKARTEFNNNKLLKEGDIAGLIGQAKLAWGDTRVNDALTAVAQDPTLKNATPEQKAVATKLLTMLQTGASLSEVLTTGVKDGSITDGSVAMSALTEHMKSIADPNVPMETKKEALTKLFADKEAGLLKEFSRQNPETLFNLYTNPSVLEAAKAAGVEDDMYSWSLKQANVLLAPLADQIYDSQVYSDTGGFSYDPGKKRFVIADAGANPRVNMNPVYANKDRAGKEAVGRMNRYLDKMEPILEANGDTVEAMLGSVFTGRDFKKMQKEGSIFTKFRDMFFKSIDESGAKNPTKQQGGGDTSPPPFVPGDRSEGGSRSWRNNNPGNIEFGNFAKSMGAIGSDGRFAIFPDYETGRKAKETLLFESKGYRGKTLEKAIAKYAPSSENNTLAYTNTVARAVGVPPDTLLAELNDDQRQAMLDAMQEVEGFKPGR